MDGVSLVLENTSKGEDIIKNVMQGHEKYNVSYEDAIRENGALVHSQPPHPQRRGFFKNFYKTKKITHEIINSVNLRFFTKTKLFTRSIIQRLKGLAVY